MSNPSVLVIDDDFAVRLAINAGLRLDGYDLLFAENGTQALEVLKEAVPRVVILDLKMPVMDGLEFLSNLDLKPSDPFSVVVLTAYVDDDSAAACYKAGVSAMVKKPFTLNELRGAVQTAIINREHSRLFRELMIERGISEGIQNRISQRLDILGRTLQELIQLQGMTSSSGWPELDAEAGDPLESTGFDDAPADPESLDEE